MGQRQPPGDGKARVRRTHDENPRAAVPTAPLEQTLSVRPTPAADVPQRDRDDRPRETTADSGRASARAESPTTASQATERRTLGTFSAAATGTTGSGMLRSALDDATTATRRTQGAQQGAQSPSGSVTRMRSQSGALVLPGELLPVPVVGDTNRQLALAETHQPPALLIRGSSKPHALGPIVPRRSGPRSFIAQFTVAMMASLIFLSAFALATPLGKTASLSGSFKSYASAIPWIPTPTPTPKPTPVPVVRYDIPPTGANPGAQAIINEIQAVFGQYAGGALNVARCESGYDPNARNTFPIGNSHASGVFQILYPGTWRTTAYAAASPYDANANIHAAYQLFQRDGNTWSEWACRP